MLGELFGKVGLTGGLLAGLIFVGALFVGERRKRRAAEVRANASREGARAANEVKDAVVSASIERDEAVNQADVKKEAEMEAIAKEADKVDRAAASGNSALANAWNRIMRRKGD